MSKASANLKLAIFASMIPTLPLTNRTDANFEDNKGWTDGNDSGEIDKVIYESDAVAAAATDSYNLLAAGSLSDILGQPVNADECKAIAVKCKTGSIKVVGGTANPMSCFTGSGEGIALSAGQTVVLNLGPTGIDVTTNATMEIIGVSAASTYDIMLLAAE